MLGKEPLKAGAAVDSDVAADRAGAWVYDHGRDCLKKRRSCFNTSAFTLSASYSILWIAASGLLYFDTPSRRKKTQNNFPDSPPKTVFIYRKNFTQFADYFFNKKYGHENDAILCDSSCGSPPELVYPDRAGVCRR
jgi:hypothetical protein